MKFIYNFLFIDHDTGFVSHTKFWSQVGYAVLTWAFVHSVLAGSTIGYEMYAFFGAIMIGNRTAKHAIKKD